MIVLCSTCGAEQVHDRVAVLGTFNERCTDCQMTTEGEVPGLVPTDEEMVYDLSEWRTRDRVALRNALVESDVPFRWEPGLVVAVHEDDVALVEQVLDDLEELGDAADDEDEDDDGSAAGEVSDEDAESAQRAMGDLFVVADRLARDTGDPLLASELDELAAVVEAVGPPYGVEMRVWGEVRRRAGELGSVLEEHAEEGVVRDAATGLRDLLRPLV